LLLKPLAGPTSIVQNAPAQSQITIRDAEVKRAEIGHIRRLWVQVDFLLIADSPYMAGIYSSQRCKHFKTTPK
jgi:hypothetical protein